MEQIPHKVFLFPRYVFLMCSKTFVENIPWKPGFMLPAENNIYHRRLCRAMMLGSFQCRGVLMLWHILGQEPAVLVAGAAWVCFFFFVCVCFLFCFLFYLVYPIFPLHRLLGDDWT